MSGCLSPQEIVQRLKGKNMTFKNEIEAERFFSENSYYRFKAYFYDLLDPNDICPEYGKKLKQNIPFDEIKKIYDFDNSLRSILFEALQNIELCLRERIVSVLSKYGADGYWHIRNLNADACNTKIQPYQPTAHEKFRNKLRDLKRNSNAPFTNSDNPLEIWKAVEIMDFGCLINLIKMMKNDDRNQIFILFGYQEYDNLFFQHIQALGQLRNKCAHHEVLWKRNICRSNITIPDIWANHTGIVNSLYNIILIIDYFCKNGIKQSVFWADSFLLHYRFKISLNVHDGYGFPENWLQDTLWIRASRRLNKALNKVIDN